MLQSTVVVKHEDKIDGPQLMIHVETDIIALLICPKDNTALVLYSTSNAAIGKEIHFNYKEGWVKFNGILSLCNDNNPYLNGKV